MGRKRIRPYVCYLTQTYGQMQMGPSNKIGHYLHQVDKMIGPPLGGKMNFSNGGIHIHGKSSARYINTWFSGLCWETTYNLKIHFHRYYMLDQIMTTLNFRFEVPPDLNPEDPKMGVEFARERLTHYLLARVDIDIKGYYLVCKELKIDETVGDPFYDITAKGGRLSKDGTRFVYESSYT